MNTAKVALYHDPGEVPVLTPEECITSMFEHTDGSGLLVIPEWPSCDPDADDKTGFYKCRMSWNEADRDEALLYCGSCLDSIRKIAPKYSSLRSGAGAEDLPATQKEIWDTFLQDLRSDDPDAALAEAEERAGRSPAVCDVILRARRLCRLMELEAPEVIIRNEACLFAQALAIHMFCQEMEVVVDVE